MGLEIQQLSKSYGKVTVLRDLTLSAESGVTAVLGPAGSGKSALAAVVATLERPSQGTVRVDGLDVRKQQPEIRRRIGYAPQHAELFDHLTVEETLDYLALVQGMDHAPARRIRVFRALERFDLTQEAARPVRSLSAGAMRRVTVAQACLGQPSLVLLDEPTAGIEPEDAVRIRTAIAEVGRESVVLLLTSVLEDVEAAGSLAVLRRGRLQFHGTVAELLSGLQGRVWKLPPVPAGSPAPRGFTPTGFALLPGGVQLRGIAEEAPAAGAEATTPELADGYAWLLARSADGTST
jgi:ABC-type multidrug transport system ATPase subunit